MDLSAAMEEVATQIDTISGLRVHTEPPSTISPPSAILAYPETFDFDGTYGRGMDRMTLPVVLVVGLASDRAARKNIAPYVMGSGASSIKQVVEAGTYTEFDTVRVTRVEFDVITVAAVDYLAATFYLDIAGQGA